MQNTRFIRIIKSFSPQEFKQFGRFVNSHTNKNLKNLYLYLKKHFPFPKGEVPAFPKGYLDERKVHKKIFPDKNFSEKRIRELSHEMLRLCEQFLACTGLLKDRFAENMFMLKEIHRRNLPEDYHHYYSLAGDYLNSLPPGYDTFNNRITLDKEHMKFYNTFDVYKAKDLVNPVINNALKSSVFELLRCFAGIKNAGLVFKEKYELKLVDEITLFLEKNNYLNDPLIELYFHLMKISLGENEQSYKAVLSLKARYSRLFDNDIQREVLFYLHNYISLYKHEPTNRIFDEKTDLTANLVKTGLFKDDNGFVFPNVLYNYVYLLISLKKYDKAEKFLNDNKERLICLNRDDYINFLFGEIFKAQGEYKKAVYFLNRLSIQDKELFSFSKIYELICYYELGYEKGLEKSAVSVQQFVMRNKSNMGHEEFEGNKLFLKYFTRLITLKQSGKALRKIRRRHSLRNSNPPVGRLKNQITKEKGFFNKQWLLSKIDTIQNVSSQKN